MRELVRDRRPRDEKDNISFWDTVRWVREVGEPVELRRGQHAQYEVWKAKLERVAHALLTDRPRAGEEVSAVHPNTMRSGGRIDTVFLEPPGIVRKVNVVSH